MFTTKSDELSFILRAHMVEGDNLLPTGCPLVHAFVCMCMSECARASVHEHVHTRTRTHTALFLVDDSSSFDRDASPSEEVFT